MIKKAYVDINEGQVHYRYGGPESGLPVVFFHQNTSSSAMFEPLLQKLESRHRVLAFDLPGFGGSYDPSEPFTDIRYLTDSMMKALDALEIQSFHVCGQHTGASMAVEMGARYPRRVKSVMNIGPLYMDEAKRDRYRQAFNGSAPPDPAGEYLLKTWETLRQGGADADLDLLHREMWEELRSWKARAWVYQCVWDHDFNSYFDQLDCPILIMAAEDDVLFHGFKNARASRPGVEAVIVGGSNFEPELDPEGVSRAILEFLAKYGRSRD